MRFCVAVYLVISGFMMILELECKVSLFLSHELRGHPTWVSVLGAERGTYYFDEF